MSLGPFQYRVAAKSSVLYDGTLYAPGAEFPCAVESICERLAAEGAIVLEFVPEPARAPVTVTLAPEAPSAPSGEAKNFAIGLDPDGSPLPAPTEQPVPRDHSQFPQGKWNLDPTALAGKPLDELNVMILERDDTAAIFETVEEAVAHLSSDFHG